MVGMDCEARFGWMLECWTGGLEFDRQALDMEIMRKELISVHKLEIASVGNSLNFVFFS